MTKVQEQHHRKGRREAVLQLGPELALEMGAKALRLVLETLMVLERQLALVLLVLVLLVLLVLVLETPLVPKKQLALQVSEKQLALQVSATLLALQVSEMVLQASVTLLVLHLVAETLRLPLMPLQLLQLLQQHGLLAWQERTLNEELVVLARVLARLMVLGLQEFEYLGQLRYPRY